MRRIARRWLSVLQLTGWLLGLGHTVLLHAAGVPTLEIVEVEAVAEDLIGTADSANQGTVLREQLESRPVYRSSELLETVPGLIVTQHSGEGKANQFFLRGLNLDHGTDLRATVDGMLVNQRSHSHGQGWADLNFFIPELVASLQYQKGPYYADQGDFSSAGAVHINYRDTLEHGIAQLELGENGYRRLLFADSTSHRAGHVLYAAELFHNDGPFTHPDDFNKINAVLRYSQGDTQNYFKAGAMIYQGYWDASDQIAKRAVESGQIRRFDLLDPSDGGEASRYSLSAAWQKSSTNDVIRANAYMIKHKLDLFSNFTYFLDNPVSGDQFAQPDQRVTTAFNASYTRFSDWAGKAIESSVGVQLQNDNIFNGLLNTQQRQRLSATREDHIVESSAALYFENRVQWFGKFRSIMGLRGDAYRFKVASDNSLNSGEVYDRIVNPKLSLIFGPWAKTEYYLNLGGGFHSNDARGTTITIDPKTGTLADEVSPLVRSRGYELGLRSGVIRGLQSSFTVYQLDFDSELLFLGDAGTTEASRRSRRSGFEFANFYKPTPWLTIDADYAYARARFRDEDPSGDRIPGAVEGVGSLSASVDHLGAWFGSVQLRYFGPRPLIEDNSVRSQSTVLLNGRIGHRFSKELSIAVEGYNLLDREDNAIDYYYSSRLPGEPAAGVNDIHFHPIESRSFRISLLMNI